MASFFSYLVKSELCERISFTDYYAATKLPGPSSAAMEVFDPVNPENNVTMNYSVTDRQRIVGAARNALDSYGDAKWATNKGDAIDCWQDILGPSFRG
jgi:tRNA nucleotidyltransferase (CCA-adding enzyme)